MPAFNQPKKKADEGEQQSDYTYIFLYSWNESGFRCKGKKPSGWKKKIGEIGVSGEKRPSKKEIDFSASVAKRL
jgi:hypothetical protein